MSEPLPVLVNPSMSETITQNDQALTNISTLKIRNQGKIWLKTSNLEEYEPTCRFVRNLLMVLYLQQKIPRLANGACNDHVKRKRFVAPSPHFSWTPTCLLHRNPSKQFNQSPCSTVHKFTLLTQGTVASLIDSLTTKPQMSTALTIFSQKPTTIPEIFVQVVSAIIDFLQTKQRPTHMQEELPFQRHGVSSSRNIVETDPWRKFSAALSQRNLAKAKILCQMKKQKLQEIGEPKETMSHKRNYTMQLPPRMPPIVEHGKPVAILTFQKPKLNHDEPQMSSLMKFDLNLNDSLKNIHDSNSLCRIDLCPEYVTVIPSAGRTSQMTEQLDSTLASHNNTITAHLKTQNAGMRTADMPPEDRRARKRLRREKRRAKLETRRKLSSHGSVHDAETERQERKRTKIALKDEALRETKKLRRLQPLPKNEDDSNENLVFVKSRCSEKDPNINLGPTKSGEFIPKKLGVGDRWLDPRIKKYDSKLVTSRLYTLKNHLHPEMPVSQNYHSRSGRELEPPVPIPTTRQPVPTSQVARSSHPYHVTETPNRTLQQLYPRTDPSQHQHPPPTYIDFPPLKFLCSESFLSFWGHATTELASGTWMKSLLPVSLEREDTVDLVLPVGRKILMHDTSLLDEIGVDVETPGRGALIVCSLASWITLDMRSQVRKHILTTAMGKYKNLDFFLCVDTEITSSLASHIALLQNSLLCNGGNCIASFRTVSPRTLSAALAQRILSCQHHQSMSFLDDSVHDDRLEQRVRFLLAIVPCLTATGALFLLRAAGQGDDNPLSEEGSRLGIQNLLGNKAYLEKCRDDIKSGQSSTHVDLGTINQIAIASLAPLRW